MPGAFKITTPRPLQLFKVTSSDLDGILQAKLLGTLCSSSGVPVALDAAVSFFNNLVPNDVTKAANECDWSVTDVLFRSYDEVSLFFEKYVPADLSDEYAMANSMVLFLFVGKGINKTYYLQWLQRRVEAILKMQFPKEQIAWDANQVPKCECVEDLARYLERSHAFRLLVWDTLQTLAKETTLFGALVNQILEWLKFSRMTGLYLIFQYIMLEIPNPVIYDNYLKTDRAALAVAVKYWNNAPEQNRPYLRILRKNADTICLGGRALLRLMYIGWKFGTKFQPSFANWAGPKPADQEMLDKLVEEYSPIPPALTSVLVVDVVGGFVKMQPEDAMKQQTVYLGKEPELRKIAAAPAPPKEDQEGNAPEKEV